jgi:cyclic AMP-dependent transcription factor ATF-4
MDTSTLTMESLALPRELYWDGKMEPISPSSIELFSITNNNNYDIESMLYDDIIANGLTTDLDNDYDMDKEIEAKQTIIISHELLNGDDIVIELTDLKQEYLLDTKLPPFLDYPTGIEITQPQLATKIVEQSPLDIAALYGVGGNFDTSVLAQLTPPQSPPQSSSSSAGASPVYQQYTEDQKNFNNVLNAIQSTPSPATSPPPPPITAAQVADIYNNGNIVQSSIADAAASFHWNVNVAAPQQQQGVNKSNEDITLQMLDEIVSTRAKELSCWSAINECETQSTSSASAYSPAPTSQADSAITTDDDEETCSSSASSPLHQHANTSSSSSSEISGSSNNNNEQQQTASLDSLSYDATKPKRTRPYGRGIEDRRIRKKEQNKNAATRYRQKKKQEMELIQSEEQILQQRHDELQRILADTKREAKYLKSLIREFYQSRLKSVA